MGHRRKRYEQGGRKHAGKQPGCENQTRTNGPRVSRHFRGKNSSRRFPDEIKETKNTGDSSERGDFFRAQHRSRDHDLSPLRDEEGQNGSEKDQTGRALPETDSVSPGG